MTIENTTGEQLILFEETYAPEDPRELDDLIEQIRRVVGLHLPWRAVHVAFTHYPNDRRPIVHNLVRFQVSDTPFPDPTENEDAS